MIDAMIFSRRHYDPETGRWTSKDSILFGGAQANLYSYTFNDPVNFIDPTGLIFAVAGSVAGALVGAITPAASGAAGAAAGGFFANVIGQVLGNGVSGGSLGSIDVGQAIASGFAGATGTAATGAMGILLQMKSRSKNTKKFLGKNQIKLVKI